MAAEAPRGILMHFEGHTGSTAIMQALRAHPRASKGHANEMFDAYHYKNNRSDVPVGDVVEWVSDFYSGSTARLARMNARRMPHMKAPRKETPQAGKVVMCKWRMPNAAFERVVDMARRQHVALVVLQRNNTLEHAVSLLHGAQTGIQHPQFKPKSVVARVQQTRVAITRDALERVLRHLKAQQHNRDVLLHKCKQRGVRVLVISYEQFVAEPLKLVAQVFRFAGLPHDAALVKRCVAHVHLTKVHSSGNEAYVTNMAQVRQWYSAFRAKR